MGTRTGVGVARGWNRGLHGACTGLRIIRQMPSHHYLSAGGIHHIVEGSQRGLHVTRQRLKTPFIPPLDGRSELISANSRSAANLMPDALRPHRSSGLSSATGARTPEVAKEADRRKSRAGTGVGRATSTRTRRRRASRCLRVPHPDLEAEPLGGARWLGAGLRHPRAGGRPAGNAPWSLDAVGDSFRVHAY